MRINSLKISNILGIRFAQVNVATPAVLFAGKNGAGKSSIQEAIRMALTGETARVNLKKEYDQLVTDGAKKGSVEVVVDRETEVITCSMELPAGKGTAADTPVLIFVLDGARFASLSPTERRKFLFDLSGVQVTPEEVTKRLLQREITQARIDAVLPLLRSGFDAAAKEAASKATQAKGAWREITGETYGSKKGETWAAEVPAFRQADLEQAEDDLARIEDELAVVAAEKGALQQKRRADNDRAARAEDLRIKANTFAGHTDRLKAAQKEYEVFLEQVNELREKAGVAPAAAPQTYECPDCGSVLVMEKGKLVHYQVIPDPIDYDPEAAARLPEYEKSLKVLENAVASRQRDLNEADQAATLLAEIEKELENAQDYSKSLETLTEKETALRGAKKEFAEKVQALRQAQQAAERAVERTEKAEQRHRDVQDWDVLADALSPDGIPGELLTEALRPINERLFASAKEAGWAHVTICSDMAITADGRAYALLSESEKWRTDALIAEAISHISGLKLLVLDRIDVLDLAGRNDLLYWVDGLALNGDIETAFLFGTLKGIPNGLPETISGYWVENGEVVEQEKAAA